MNFQNSLNKLEQQCIELKKLNLWLGREKLKRTLIEFVDDVNKERVVLNDEWNEINKIRKELEYAEMELSLYEYLNGKKN